MKIDDQAVTVVVEGVTYAITIARIETDVELRPSFKTDYHHHPAFWGHRVVLCSTGDDGTVAYARLECTYERGGRGGPLTRWHYEVDEAPTLEAALTAPRRSDGRTIWTALDDWINTHVAAERGSRR